MFLEHQTRLDEQGSRIEGHQVLVKATPGTQPICSSEDDSQAQASLCYALMDRQTQQLPLADDVVKEPSRVLEPEEDKTVESQYSLGNSCQQSQMFSHFGLGADTTDASGLEGHAADEPVASILDQSDNPHSTDVNEEQHPDHAQKESAVADSTKTPKPSANVGPATSPSQPHSASNAARTAKSSASRHNPRPKPLPRSSNRNTASSPQGAPSSPTPGHATSPTEATTQLESQLYGQDVYPAMNRGTRGRGRSTGRPGPSSRRPTTSTPATALRTDEVPVRQPSPFDDSFTRPSGSQERGRFFSTEDAHGLNVSIMNLSGDARPAIRPTVTARRPSQSPTRSPPRSPHSPSNRSAQARVTYVAPTGLPPSRSQGRGGAIPQSRRTEGENPTGQMRPISTIGRGRAPTQPVSRPSAVSEVPETSEESQNSSLSTSSAPPQAHTQQQSLVSSVLVPETPSISTGSGESSNQIQAPQPPVPAASAPPVVQRAGGNSSQPSSISSFTDLPPAAQPAHPAPARSISSLEYSSGSHPSRGSDENSDPNARPLPQEVKPVPSTPPPLPHAATEPPPEVEITPTQPSGIGSQDPIYTRFRDRFLQPLDARPILEDTSPPAPRRLLFEHPGQPRDRPAESGVVPHFGVPPPPPSLSPTHAQIGRPPLVQLQRSNRPPSPQGLQPPPPPFSSTRFDEQPRPFTSARQVHPHPLSRDRHAPAPVSNRNNGSVPVRQLQPLRRQVYEDDQDELVAATPDVVSASREQPGPGTAGLQSSPDVPLSTLVGMQPPPAAEQEEEDTEPRRRKKPTSSSTGARGRTQTRSRGRSTSRGGARPSKRTFADLDDQSEEEEIREQFDVTIPTQRAQEAAKEILAGQKSSPIRRYGDPRSSASPRQYMSKAKQARKRPRLSAERERSADASDEEQEVDEEVVIERTSPAKTNTPGRKILEVVIPPPSPSIERMMSKERGSRRRGRSASQPRRGAAPSRTRGRRRRAAGRRGAVARREADEVDGDTTTEEERSDVEAGPSRGKRPRSFSEPLPTVELDQRIAKRHRTSFTGADIPVTRVLAYWSSDRSYYPGVVQSTSKGKFKVNFDDGESRDVEPHQLRRGDLRIGDIINFKTTGYTGVGPVHDISLWPEGPLKVLLVRKGKEDIVIDISTKEFKIPLARVTHAWSDRLVDIDALRSAVKAGRSTVVKLAPIQTRARRTATTVSRHSVRPISATRQTPVPENRKVFSGIAFVITIISSKNADKDKKQLTTLINNGGGQVYDNWNQLYALKTSAGRPASRDDFKWSCKKKDVGTVLLLSDRPSHTPKYLMALALGVPCVSTRWVEVHSSGFDIGWQSCLLAAGKTDYMEDVEVSQYLDPGWSKDERLTKDVFLSEVIRRPWKGLSILCIFESSHGPKSSRSVFVPMMCAMGASRIEVISDIRERDDFGSFDFIIFKDDDPAMRRLDQDIGCPVRTVNWFKQCLIMGAILPA
ncbi:hypothetical protein FRC02_005944 [Tulasnella sp. 418]|nr:hypothetical protein FRC02_005944 [Tulasnella sp. 418]